MRVSTKQLFTQGISQMLSQQQDISRIRNQISTGQRILSPADDPAGSARVLEIDRSVSVTNQFQTNIGIAEARLGQSEAVLDNVTNNLRRVRELAISGSSGHLTNEDRDFIAAEVRQRLDELLVLANSQDSNGEYLYAGYQSDAQPFSRDASGQVVYNGDQGRRFLQIGPGRQVADRDTGDGIFMAVRNGNGTFVTEPDAGNTGSGVVDPGAVVDSAAYQPQDFRIVFTAADSYDIVNDTTGTTIASGQAYEAGAGITFNGIQTSITGAPAAGDEFDVGPSGNQSAFTAVSRLAQALETDILTDQDAAAFRHVMNRTLTDIDLVLEGVLEVRTDIGARLNALDAQEQINADAIFQLTSVRSDLQDVDLVEAVIELNLAATSLEAAQQAFARTQNLTLFNFL